VTAVNRGMEKHGGALRGWMGLLILLAMALPSVAKVGVDFDPNLAFSQFKTLPTSAGWNTW
jgi:hypothetical protein